MERVNHPPLLGTCRGLSFSLTKFTWKAPHHRLGILQMVRRFASRIKHGSRVLDVGAGTAPYRELFPDCEYKTCDAYATGTVDLVCPIDRIPLADASQDAILATEVLEHVPDPVAALKELQRLLAPKGLLCVTVPFLLGIHEKRDYFRFTRDGLREIIERSGLKVLELTPRLGLPMTLWSFLWTFSLWVARPEEPNAAGKKILRFLAGSPFLALSVVTFLPLWFLDELDKKQESALGYALLAEKG